MIELKHIIVVDTILQAYLILMIADFITGFLKAWKTEGFKSRKIRDGVIRVIGELVAIAVGGVLDIIMGLHGVTVLAIKWLFIFKEFVSIAENLGAVDVNLPPWIADKVEEIKEKYNNNPTDKEGE